MPPFRGVDAHDSRSSTVERLTTRSKGTSAATALRQPRPSHSSWPGAWASVSMAKEHPSSTARRSRSSGGSWRSGRELISTAVPVRAHGLEHRLGVERRLRPAAADDDAAGAVPEDVGVRALDRRQHPCGHLPGVHPQLGVHAGDDDVELAEQVEVEVERHRPRGCRPPSRSGGGTAPVARSGRGRSRAVRASRSSLSPWATVRRALWSVRTR